MEQEHDGVGEDPRDGPDLSGWQLLLFAQFLAVLIALVMPVTPSKTGGKASLAEYFLDKSGYLYEVILSFILVNLIYVFLFLIGFLYVKWDRWRRGA